MTQPQHSPDSPPRILLAILFGFTILGLIYSVVVPIFEISDELWHYPMVEHLARTWALPVQPLEPGTSSGPWRQEASQPPLYYAIAAALTAWIDTSDMDQVRHLNPHVAAGEVTPDRSNPNLVVHNPALERFPWRGTVLAVHIVRIFSVLLGTWAIYLTWALVRELYPSQPNVALIAAAIHAFTPMYLFISASVNNDNLVVPLCSLALLQMARLVKNAQNPEPKTRNHLALGVVLGLGLLTKASAIGLLPLAAATIAWETWRKMKLRITNYELRITKAFTRYSLFAIRYSLFVLLPALAISGWWFYRNFRLYGDWLGLNAFYAVLGIRDVAADFAQLWAERFAFAAGYWGNFGGLNVPMPDFIYTILNAFAILAFVVLVAQFLRWVTGYRLQVTGSTEGVAEHRASSIQHPASKIANLWPFTWDPLTAARALAWAWPAAVFVSWMRWATITWSSQGRLIFSAMPMWALALVLPISRKSKVQSQESGSEKQNASILHLASCIFPAFLLILCLAALPAWIVPAYLPPDDPVPAVISNPHVITFGDTLRLHGYAIKTDAVQPGDPVRLALYWEALAPTPTDHSIFVHVLGNGERIIAQRDAFPGRGLLSTTWLEPGQTWTEHYAIAVPALAYAPDTLTFAIGMYETATGQRLQVFDAGGVVQGEIAFFGQAQLAPPTDPVRLYFGKGVVLDSYDLTGTFAQTGEPFTVTFHWEAVAPIDADYTISVQLIDAQWHKAAQSDAWPLDGAAPTSSWQVGQRIDEPRTLTIAADAAPGVYDLQLTIYRMNEDGEFEHLPIIWEKGQMPAKTVVLTRVRVQ